jgi:hypothetical protein
VFTSGRTYTPFSAASHIVHSSNSIAPEHITRGTHLAQVCVLAWPHKQVCVLAWPHIHAVSCCQPHFIQRQHCAQEMHKRRT